MPFVHVSTNVPKAGVDADAAVRALSKSLSDALDRPEPYVMAQLDLEVPMLFQGSDAVRNNPEYSSAHCRVLCVDTYCLWGTIAVRVRAHPQHWQDRHRAESLDG